MQAPFLPDSLSGWTGLLLQLFAAVSSAVFFSVGVIRKPLTDVATRDREKTAEGFAKHGERIGHLDTLTSANTAKIESLDRQSERLHLQLTSLAEGHGRMEEQLVSITRRLETYHEQRMTETRQIGERLARIEARMSIPHQQPRESST